MQRSSELVVGRQVRLGATGQAQGAILRPTMVADFGAGIAAQITVAQFNRSPIGQLLDHTGLQADRVAVVRVTTGTRGVLRELGHARAGATEQLGGISHREEQVVAAEQVFLAKLVTAVVTRDVVVGHVVAALVVDPPQAHAPGVVLADDAVGIEVVGVALQQAGLADLVAGLAIGQAGEVVVGLGGHGETCGANGHGGNQGIERFHGFVLQLGALFLSGS